VEVATTTSALLWAISTSFIATVLPRQPPEPVEAATSRSIGCFGRSQAGRIARRRVFFRGLELPAGPAVAAIQRLLLLITVAQRHGAAGCVVYVVWASSSS